MKYIIKDTVRSLTPKQGKAWYFMLDPKYLRELRFLTHAWLFRGDSHLNVEEVKKWSYLWVHCTFGSMQPRSSAPWVEPQNNQWKKQHSVIMPDLNSFLPLQSSKFFINLSTYLSIILSIYSYLLLLPGNRLVTGSPVVCCLSLCLTGEQLRKVLSADKKPFIRDVVSKESSGFITFGSLHVLI